jgi:hypothetical protein
MMRIVVLLSTIALMGCATPNIEAGVTGSGVRADVQLCFDDSSLGKNIDKYTGGLLSALMGCPEVE